MSAKSLRALSAGLRVAKKCLAMWKNHQGLIVVLLLLLFWGKEINEERRGDWDVCQYYVL